MGSKNDPKIIAETDFNLSKYSKTQQVTDRLLLNKPARAHEFTLTDNDFIEVVVKATVLESDSETPRGRVSMRKSTSIQMDSGMQQQMEMGNLPYIPASPRVSIQLNKASTKIMVDEISQSLVIQAEKSQSSVVMLREKFKEKETVYQSTISMLEEDIAACSE